MKVLISADMEGITGVVSSDQVNRDGKDYDRARKWMTAEVNAAVRGAFAGGATQVIVNDSHDTMRNILLDELHPEAELITGGTKALSMMQGLDASVDAVFFIGYHAKKGTSQGVLDHTYDGSSVMRYSVNGVEYGETGQNALIAGAMGVPVVLVTGDTMVTEEAREILGDIETVAVKDGISRFAAKTLHPSKAHALIEAAAERALKRVKEMMPVQVPGPYRIEVELKDSYMADLAELIPGVEKIAPRVVQYEHPDYLVAYKCFRAIIGLT